MFGSGVPGALARIRDEVQSWKGVHAEPGRFGSVRFLLGRRELGHVHGDWFADLPVPHALHDQLIATGRAEPHRFLPESGWVTFPLRHPADVDALIALLKQQYERMLPLWSGNASAPSEEVSEAESGQAGNPS